MPTITIGTTNLNNNIDVVQAFAFAKTVEEAVAINRSEKFTINIPDQAFFHPFALLFIANVIKRLKSMISDVHLSGDYRKPYLEIMNFRDCISENKLSVTSAIFDDDKSYLPITTLNRNDLESSEPITSSNHPINKAASELSKFLLQKDQGDDVRVVAYCLKELIRNFVEHSGSECSSLLIAGQYYQNGPEAPAEIAILDSGCGLLRSLTAEKTDLKDQIKSDREAICAALEAGLSGKKYANTEGAVNSGFGLYIMHEFAELAGRLSIASGDKGLTMGKKYMRRWDDTRHFGTAVGLRLDTKFFLKNEVQQCILNIQEKSKLKVSEASLMTFDSLKPPNKKPSSWRRRK